MSILGLRTTIYKVGPSDLAKAREWYSVAFGVKPYFDQPFYVGFNVGGYELGVQPEDATTAEGEKSLNVATFWGVDDIASEFERFLKLGSTAVEKPTNVGGEIMVATVKDPWGNLIGLIYNPEFKLP